MAVPQKHADMIRSIRVKLGQNLIFDDLYNALEERGLISKTQRERLENPTHAPGQRRDDLINDLLSGTSEMLRKFVDCLKVTNQMGLVNYIKQAAQDFGIPESEYMPIDSDKLMKEAPTPPQTFQEEENSKIKGNTIKTQLAVLETDVIPDSQGLSSSSLETTKMNYQTAGKVHNTQQEDKEVPVPEHQYSPTAGVHPGEAFPCEKSVESESIKPVQDTLSDIDDDGQSNTERMERTATDIQEKSSDLEYAVQAPVQMQDTNFFSPNTPSESELKNFANLVVDYFRRIPVEDWFEIQGQIHDVFRNYQRWKSQAQQGQTWQAQAQQAHGPQTNPNIPIQQSFYHQQRLPQNPFPHQPNFPHQPYFPQQPNFTQNQNFSSQHNLPQ